MPNMNILPDGRSISDALVLISALDEATITTRSSTQIVFTTNLFLSGTYTLTGTGLTTSVIGGVRYLTGGTVANILVKEGANSLYSFTGLGLFGLVLDSATRADREGTDQAALENLFRGLIYTINGSSGADAHVIPSSFEGISLALTAGTTYDLGAGNDIVVAASNANDVIFGGAGNDRLLGNGGNDSIIGDFDNETVFGGSGNDTLFGGSGIDSVSGNEGNDTLFLGDKGQLFGGTGHDTLNGSLLTGSTLFGGAGNDLLIGGRAVGESMLGGEGIDTVSYAASGLGVTVNLATTIGTGGDAGEDFLHEIEKITGSGHDDVLGGSLFANVLLGGAGKDFLFGKIGIDTLDGGTGNDTLDGGTGIDVMTGGTGAGDFDALTDLLL